MEASWSIQELHKNISLPKSAHLQFLLLNDKAMLFSTFNHYAY